MAFVSQSHPQIMPWEWSLMPHLGHRAPFLYESGLVTTTPVRMHFQLSRGTRSPGEVTRVPAPPPAGSPLAPPPPGASQRPFVPLSPGLPILEKFQEKNQRQKLNRQALVTLVGRGRYLSGGSRPSGCLF